MASTRNIINAEAAGSRREIRRALADSLTNIRDAMSESSETCYIGSAEWRSEVEALIDLIHNEVFCLSEPRASTPEEHREIRELRSALRDLYVRQIACG